MQHLWAADLLTVIMRATGKAYHPQCFTCVVCACPLEGTSFIVDQANRPHCVPDYHK